ncbi:putative DsbA family dithiol-disulfide isomerase [Rhizobium sp. BK068]|nr:putative DsbA family dithiol-disulfide isomerase [Rhizobium sp. BK060]TCM75147.1 putative DsbA family dithiol-disulfide isomerase [Rhizobium sp. BK068]
MHHRTTPARQGAIRALHGSCRRYQASPRSDDAGRTADGLYIPDLLLARYGVSDPKAAFARPEAEARASGLELNLSRQLWTYPTHAAHALILAARDRGTQHPLAVAICAAHFLGAKNISDADLLADIAADHGFDHLEGRTIAMDPAWHARVEQAAAQSAAAGIRSVPHFVFGGRVAINGGRSEDEIALAISEVVASG